MDGSENSVTPGASNHSNALDTSAITAQATQLNPDGVSDPTNPIQQRDEPVQGTKRGADSNNDTASSKRQHVEAEVGEDLDLDALLAQLQEHTEQASSATTGQPPQSNADEGGGNQSSEAREEESEQSRKESVNRQDNGIEETHNTNDNAHGDTGPDATRNVHDENESEFSIEQQLKADKPKETWASEEKPGHSDESPVSGVVSEKKPDSESSEKPEKASGKEAGSSIEKSADKQESLISLMPLPPAHLRGKLPPMPPPPAAFTSPTVPYSAELAQNKSRPTSVASATSSHPASASLPVTEATNKQPSNDLRSLPVGSHPPKFSEVPQLTEKYGNQLADQVDKIYRESQTTADPGNEKQSQYYALHLNENKAILQARKRSILLMDSLACQVLDTLSSNHYQDTLTTVMQPGSDRGMTYRILLDAFEDVKRMYMQWETQSSRTKAEPKLDEVRPFLQGSIPGVESTRDNLVTFQRVNLATFVAAVFGSIEIGFWELNDCFIKVFVPENGRLLKQQANIYLELKTQAYISALESTDDEEVRAAALDHLFPPDLETQIQDMFGERVSLAPTEKDFVAKCQRRKENIKSEDAKILPSKYHWVPFLRDLSEYISRNHYTLLPQRKYSIMPTEVSGNTAGIASPQPMRAYPGTRRQAPAPSTRVSAVQSTESSKNISRTASTGSVREVGKPSSETPSQTSVSMNPKLELDDFYDGSTDKAKASSSQQRNKSESLEPESQSDDHEKSQRNEVAGHLSETEKPRDLSSEQSLVTSDPKQHPEVPVEGHPLFPPLPKQVLPRPAPGQSPQPKEEPERRSRFGTHSPAENPTSVGGSPPNTLAVYEAARASAEGTDLVRPKASLYTVRRTWTKEEEEALLKGMDRVQGPYWAQILELYGPGGKINEVLKDRSQVQLKDKARNLKMFFVRLGLPIPAVFQYVTGDYETRKSSSKRVREKKQIKSNSAPQQSQILQPPPSHDSAVLIESSNAPSKTVSSQISTNLTTGNRNDASSPTQTRSAGEVDQNEQSNSANSVPSALSNNNESSDRHEDTPSAGQSGSSVSANRSNVPAKDVEKNDDSKDIDRSGEVSTDVSNKDVEHQTKNIEPSGEANDDKPSKEDEDLSSLLDRVGEYVDSH